MSAETLALALATTSGKYAPLVSDISSASSESDDANSYDDDEKCIDDKKQKPITKEGKEAETNASFQTVKSKKKIKQKTMKEKRMKEGTTKRVCEDSTSPEKKPNQENPQIDRSPR